MPKLTFSPRDMALFRMHSARRFLAAMLASVPICDRTLVNERVWARKAVQFAIALEKELKRKGS